MKALGTAQRHIALALDDYRMTSNQGECCSEVVALTFYFLVSNAT